MLAKSWLHYIIFDASVRLEWSHELKDVVKQKFGQEVLSSPCDVIPVFTDRAELLNVADVLQESSHSKAALQVYNMAADLCALTREESLLMSVCQIDLSKQPDRLIQMSDKTIEVI